MTLLRHKDPHGCCGAAIASCPDLFVDFVAGVALFGAELGVLRQHGHNLIFVRPQHGCGSWLGQGVGRWFRSGQGLVDRPP